MDDRYRSIPSFTGPITAANVICRMLAGMGFRFYWATEALTEEAYAFRPCDGARSISDTVEHVWDLLNWVYRSIEPAGEPKPSGPQHLRAGALELIATLQGAFSNMTDDDLAGIRIREQPFWAVINGPLSDVLTHIGQITALRRLAGSPVPASNPFKGTPPA
jgi:hypothetical protein